jgi:hypothetical protein
VKRPLLIALGALFLIMLIAVLVSLSVASDLRAVKGILSQDTQDLEVDEVEEARLRLQRSRDRLESLPARMLRLVPIMGRNLTALHSVIDASIPTLQAGLNLKDAVTGLEEGGLIKDGRVRISALKQLQQPIGIQVDTMAALVENLERERNGWLAPPLWSSFDEMLERANGLLRDARSAEEALDMTDDLLGRESPRTYLVLLLNNAELRGAGGLLSGVGTIDVEKERLRLGDFQSVHGLRDRPPRRVKAPSEYERRFGVFDANTTLWLNASYSPDVPDVALVASRLFRLKTGQHIDGAIVIDPRGVAALLPSDETVNLPGIGLEIPVEESADFVYSDAYEIFTDQETRRNAVLALGKAAFEKVLKDGLGGEDVLFELADAVGGGHLRFVSFDPDEQAVLDDLRITGELSLPDEDAYGLLVTVQNLGGGTGQGTKLDFWARRSIAHSCKIDEEDPIVCTTTTTLANRAPRGLTTYVTGPDGALRSYLETYIPAEAKLRSVDLDGKPAEVRTEAQAGRTSVAVFAKVARGDRKQVRVHYELPPARRSYELIVGTQPLAVDAHIDVELQIPSGWTADGAGDLDDGTVNFTGRLENPLRFAAYPDRRTGVPALWERLKRFWNKPLI